MAWAEPEYSSADVNWAGNTLRSATDFFTADMNHALQIINNWRAAHAFPLNTFQITLRQRGRPCA